MSKVITIVCGIFLLASCMRDVETRDPNTDSDYDYIEENLVTCNGTWKNNWDSTFDPSHVEYVPEVESRQYKGLELFIKPFKGEDVIIGECKKDENLYVEIWVVYKDDGSFENSDATVYADANTVVPEEAVVTGETEIAATESAEATTTEPVVVETVSGEKAFLINEANMDDYLVATNYSNTRIRLDFDNLPATTTRLAIKLLSGKTSGYIMPKFEE